jgi:hypothetical protein
VDQRWGQVTATSSSTTSTSGSQDRRAARRPRPRSRWLAPGGHSCADWRPGHSPRDARTDPRRDPRDISFMIPRMPHLHTEKCRRLVDAAARGPLDPQPVGRGSKGPLRDLTSASMTQSRRDRPMDTASAIATDKRPRPLTTSDHVETGNMPLSDRKKTMAGASAIPAGGLRFFARLR